MSLLIVWDLDDTLMDNVHDYSQPILDSIAVIVRELGHKAPHVKDIMRIEDEIDKARISEINPRTGEPYLFGMDRFPGSMVQTYAHICREVGVEPDDVVKRELWNIGMQAFDESRYAGNIRPEAGDVLAAAAKMSVAQVLMTKGDQRVQERKLHALGEVDLLRYFQETLIVPQKAATEFTEVATWADSRICAGLTFVSVGNSYRSDIEPALESGYRGILVPVWNWEEIHNKEELYAQADADDRVFIADALSGIPAILAEMTR